MGRYDFSGKIALVTGATSGIGQEVARKLALGGAYVVLSGRDETRGLQAVAEIQTGGGAAAFVRADLSETHEIAALAKRALMLGGGRVDILVNSAGVFPYLPTVRVSAEDFDHVYHLNVRAPFQLVATLAPVMGQNGGGSIVNITSTAATLGVSGMALYGSSKAALQLLSKAWAAEFAPVGVRVNAVSPGGTITQGTAGFRSQLERTGKSNPSGRVSEASEVADAVVFLVSDSATHIHGAVLPVDGGRVAI